MIWINMQHQRK